MKKNTFSKSRLFYCVAILCLSGNFVFAQKAGKGISALSFQNRVSGKPGRQQADMLNVGAAQFTDTTLLFEPKTDGYTMFHVPSLTITKKGTILAFAEGRFGQGKDWDDIDLVIRRSTDNGATWTPLKILVPHTPGKPTSNIVPIADRDGSVHLLYQVNYVNAYYIRSTDEGATWSKPVDITYAFDKFKGEYPWHVLAPGPGHGIQMASGRLLVPVWLCIPNKKIPGGDHRPSCVATIYSDDFGKTWNRGKIIINNGDVGANGDTIINPNESVVAQMADGRIMINMRNENLVNRRLISYSPDGISDWTKPAFDNELYDAVCMASMIKTKDVKTGKNLLLFINPDSRNNATPYKKGRPVFKPRENITARLSYDEGKTWPVHRTLFPNGSGYSDVAVNKNGMFYCLYEKQDGDYKGWKYRVVMQRFNLDWLTQGNK